MRLRLPAMLIVVALCAAAKGEPLTLWYDKPAANWEHDGLPIGNGALGAVVMGGVATEDIPFNEKTLWTGGPGAPGYDYGLPPQALKEKLAGVQARLAKDGSAKPEDVAAILGHPVTSYGDYQTFGDLVLWFDKAPATPKAYRRSLDLATGVARVSYEADGVRYTREYFASYPAHAIVIRLTASKPGKLRFTALLRTPDNRSASRTARDGRITETGVLDNNGLRYEAQVQVIAKGGMSGDDIKGEVFVDRADSAVLILSAGTNYLAHYPDYRGPDPHEGVTARVDAAAKKPYAALLKEHTADVSRLMGRVRLDIGQKVPNVATDVLVKSYGRGGPSDRALEALFFQYGRYLLIASSRAGSLPANLQGVWNATTTPPWNDDYHVNINLQMNYWLADVTALPETLEPFHAFVDGLVAPGTVSAERVLGTKGWTLFLNTDIWGYTGLISWPTAFWQPEAGAWLASQYYDHYRFTLDRSFLARAYPVMKGAAEVWLDALVIDPRDGKLVVSPSYSPEHGPFSAGAAMSEQIVYGLFAETAEAARLTGDGAFAAKLDAALKKLDPGLATGKWGQLKEWKEDWDDPKDEHRHTSHLYALHPGWQITPLGTPALAEAAKVSLRARGDSTTEHGEAGTGWSKAWKMNFWARLYDGDHAHRLLAQLLKENAMPNLWDQYVGPPFQIDGNFGATAGIAEMLLQSQTDVIDILPALPQAWSDGSVRGLRARGGIGVDIVWRKGRVTRFTLVATHGGTVRVRSKVFEGRFAVADSSGRMLALTDSGAIRRIKIDAGKRYTVTAF